MIQIDQQKMQEAELVKLEKGKLEERRVRVASDKEKRLTGEIQSLHGQLRDTDKLSTQIQEYRKGVIRLKDELDCLKKEKNETVIVTVKRENELSLRIKEMEIQHSSLRSSSAVASDAAAHTVEGLLVRLKQDQSDYRLAEADFHERNKEYDSLRASNRLLSSQGNEMVIALKTQTVALENAESRERESSVRISRLQDLVLQAQQRAITGEGRGSD
jgi:hypothetical protein